MREKAMVGVVGFVPKFPLSTTLGTTVLAVPVVGVMDVTPMLGGSLASMSSSITVPHAG
jgi:hypothetical protein